MVVYIFRLSIYGKRTPSTEALPGILTSRLCCKQIWLEATVPHVLDHRDCSNAVAGHISPSRFRVAYYFTIIRMVWRLCSV